MKSTIANLPEGVDFAAVCVAPAIKNPTVTMMPHVWEMERAEMFDA